MFTALQVVGLKRVNLSLIGTEQIEQHHKGWMKKETYYEKDSLWDILGVKLTICLEGESLWILEKFNIWRAWMCSPSFIATRPSD